MTHIVTNPRDDEIAEFRRLAAKLGHPTMPDLHIAVKLVDKDGKVLEDRYEQGHSWTRNAWSMHHMIILDSASPDAASSAGNTSYSKGKLGLRSANGSFSAGSRSIDCTYKYGDASSNYGLQVGTSNEPFSSEDFYLWGPITSGVGTGQLSYLTMTWTAPVLDTVSNTYSQTLSRVFNNNSTAAIVVREVGLTNSSGYLMTRDVLSSPINVPVGAQLTISVVVTTGSFAGLDATSVTHPALGTATQGGIYLGPWSDSSYGWLFPFNHVKYGLIVSPAAGDSGTGLQWRTTATATAGTSNNRDGISNTAALIALGAASPVGQFCANANAANLGGYNDWYVPSYYELYYPIYNNRALITGADALANANYWSSYTENNTQAYYVNPQTQSVNSFNQTTAYRVRLVRRAKLA